MRASCYQLDALYIGALSVIVATLIHPNADGCLFPSPIVCSILVHPEGIKVGHVKYDDMHFHPKVQMDINFMNSFV